MIERQNATSPNSLGTSSRARTSVATKTRTLPAASAAPAQATPLTARLPRARIGFHHGLAGQLPGEAGVVAQHAAEAPHQRLGDEHPGQQRQLAPGEGEGV